MVCVCVCAYVYKPIYSQRPTQPTHFDPTDGDKMNLQMLAILLTFSIATQELN